LINFKQIGKENMFQNKTILVTGGTGSIGSEIVNATLQKGARKVIAFSRDEAKHFWLRKRIDDTRLINFIGDVVNARDVETVFANHKVDMVYHAAAMKHVVMCEEFPHHAALTNVLGTQNVIDMAQKYDVARVMCISTDKAVAPVNVMGATKYIAERITINANLKNSSGQIFSCVRFGNVAGSRGSVIPVFIERLLSHSVINVTDPDVTRFIMSIQDAVNLILKATALAKGGEIFILKMKSLRLADLVTVIKTRIAPKLNVPGDEIYIKETGLVRGEKLHEELINSDESSRIREMDGMYVVFPSTMKINESLDNFDKIDLPSYRSESVELISLDDIEKMVLDYLGSMRAAYL
jgi:UDP-N-acetylglucosamine 4,6-dehydratase/5-epimerase